MLYFGAVLIFPFVSMGSLLPTWMFVNSLSLLAHLPLLNTDMPGNVHFFLNDYLDKVRWYDSEFVESVEAKYSLKKYDVDMGSFHHFLKSCGYEHLVAHNLIIVFAALTLICFVWAVVALKDLFVKLSHSRRPCLRKRHEKKCSNFTLRFVYEFFLEFCIVALINLSVRDFNSV